MMTEAEAATIATMEEGKKRKILAQVTAESVVAFQMAKRQKKKEEIDAKDTGVDPANTKARRDSQIPPVNPEQDGKAKDAKNFD